VTRNNLKPKKIAIIATLSVGAIVLGIRVWVSYTPIQLGPVLDSTDKCATNQKYLYQSLEFYVHENGCLPDNLDEFRVNGFPATMVWRCPVTQHGYDVFLENYGDPKAVVISDREHKHPTTFELWFRGYRSQVQTMGDGTIHFFKGGKIVTMNGARSRPFKPKDPPSLASQPLPNLTSLSVDVPLAAIEGKRLAICFFDVNQRPSRHYVTQLASRAESLKDDGFVCMVVQASQTDPYILNQWVQSNAIPFTVETIKVPSEKTCFNWGVRSLPWLILADNKHSVVSEGISIKELDSRLDSEESDR
jgi:hypothetical protein